MPLLGLIVLLIVLGVIMSFFTIDPVLLKMIYCLVVLVVLFVVLGATGLLNGATDGHPWWCR